jgi:hypothetical protein
MKLDKLKEKYPHHKIKYEPKSDCDYCSGTGERRVVAGITLCACTCVDHEHAEWFMGALHKIAIEGKRDA